MASSWFAIAEETTLASMVDAETSGALSNALLLEQLVDPESISGENVHTLLTLFFDLITGE